MRYSETSKTKRVDFVHTPINDCVDQINQLENYIAYNTKHQRAMHATDEAERILEDLYAQLERLQSE